MICKMEIILFAPSYTFYCLVIMNKIIVSVRALGILESVIDLRGTVSY